jgi:hypothetical protein
VVHSIGGRRSRAARYYAEPARLGFKLAAFRGCNVYVSTNRGRSTAVATDYVVEKLVVAVESLAVSAAPIQQRLGNAWMGALVHLRPDDFDDPRARSLRASETP